MTSANDRAILNSIFNPLLPIGEFTYDQTTPDDLTDETTEQNKENNDAVKELESKGVKAAESGSFDVAMKYFNEAIFKDQKKASSYNNRAQTYRLLGRNEDAMKDLNTAIELSKGSGRTACQAYIQRALIYRLSSQDEEAKKDFKCAADLGSEYAKNQLVQMNPYAAMCNKMLHEMFTRIQKGEVSG